MPTTAAIMVNVNNKEDKIKKNVSKEKLYLKVRNIDVINSMIPHSAMIAANPLKITKNVLILCFSFESAIITNTAAIPA